MDDICFQADRSCVHFSSLIGCNTDRVLYCSDHLLIASPVDETVLAEVCAGQLGGKNEDSGPKNVLGPKLKQILARPPRTVMYVVD